jgi:hypothetical protein
MTTMMVMIMNAYVYKKKARENKQTPVSVIIEAFYVR